MTPCRIRRWVTILLIFLTAADAAESRQDKPEQQLPTPRFYVAAGGYDFVCTRVLPDGEVERRIHKGRISAIETTVELAAPATGENSQVLTLLQVTDGRHFIQLIYDSGWELRDCEYLKSAKSVDEFYEAFAADVDCPQQQNESRAATLLDVAIAGSGSSSNLTRPDVTDYSSLRRECKTLHKRIREMALSHQSHQQNADNGLQRLKRDLFLYPGTNWCGSGSNARKFNELGYNAAADRCCRDHDHCPYTIEGFTRKFNFFNFRFHTISHCDCDERFRACLKLSGTAAGNMVGKLFFNVVQTKCFLFKHVKSCAKRSWWGKCLKFEKEKMAVLRDALKY